MMNILKKIDEKALMYWAIVFFILAAALSTWTAKCDSSKDCAVPMSDLHVSAVTFITMSAVCVGVAGLMSFKKMV